MAEPPTPLYVRLAAEQARRLDQAVSASGKSKRRLVEDAVREHLSDDGLVVGRIAFSEDAPAWSSPSTAATAAREILTAAEAAALLRVDEGELVAAARRRKLPGRSIAGQWRFSRTALLSWLGRQADERESNLPAAAAGVERSDAVLEPGPEYVPGDPVRVRVVHREHRTSVTDGGRAIEKAGRPSGWREAADRVADELVVNVSQRGVISLPIVRGDPWCEEEIVDRIAQASLALYQELLDLEG